MGGSCCVIPFGYYEEVNIKPFMEVISISYTNKARDTEKSTPKLCIGLRVICI